jgi:hypothetical protein
LNKYLFIQGELHFLILLWVGLTGQPLPAPTTGPVIRPSRLGTDPVPARLPLPFRILPFNRNCSSGLFLQSRKNTYCIPATYLVLLRIVQVVHTGNLIHIYVNGTFRACCQPTRRGNRLRVPVPGAGPQMRNE